MVKITQKESRSWVTFSFSSEGAKLVELSGEWNGWEKEPMKVKKSGEFYITKILKTGESYAFGYQVDGTRWMCDDQLCSVSSPFGSNNSLLEL